MGSERAALQTWALMVTASIYLGRPDVFRLTKERFLSGKAATRVLSGHIISLLLVLCHIS